MAIDINIPSQVKNYANLAGFPATGSLKTIFIAEDTNKTYRWTGSAYVEISASQATVWGAITGTLSSQTDLNTALNGKVPTSRTLTINGTTQDLSADRTFTISTGITIGTTAITSGTVGRVLFEGTGNVVQESANLFWDNTNGRLGIGTSSPSATLSVSGIVSLVNSVGTNRTTDLRTSNSIDNFPTTTFYPSSGTNVGQSFQVIPRGTGFSAGIKAQFALSGTDTIADGTNFEAMVVRATGSAFTFSSGKGGTGTIRPMLFSSGFLDGVTNANQLWLYTTGNIGINTTTDAGFKLDVNGTARVQSTLTAAAGFKILGAAGAGHRFMRTNDNGDIFPINAWNYGNATGNTWINGADVASSIFTLNTTTQGFLPPRMTTTQKNAIASPAAGLVVYDTTLNKLCVRTASAWETITSL
jgi:hypothetical protein